MDYIFWSVLRRHGSTDIVASYDIACQWHRNLLTRASSLPTHLRLNFTSLSFNFVIPKFHIAAHGDSCQSRFSLNFKRHMARTDGENIERGWAWMNPASLSTREMGPATRRDVLDDQWSAWNWRNLTRLGESLAIGKRNVHH